METWTANHLAGESGCFEAGPEFAFRHSMLILPLAFQQSLDKSEWVRADQRVGVNEIKIAMYVTQELKQITFCKVGSSNVIIQFHK